jgi:DNA primase
VTNVIDAAKEFYAAKLDTAEAEPARAFMERLGMKTSAGATYGFAPPSGVALVTHLRALGFSDGDIIVSKLATAGPQGPIDTLQGRVVTFFTDNTVYTMGVTDADSSFRSLLLVVP